MRNKGHVSHVGSMEALQNRIEVNEEHHGFKS